MAIRRRTKYPTSKPPINPKPPRFKKIGGVKKRFTGKGRLGVGLGLHGKGKKITKKGYTGKGRYGYGTGAHGHPGATTPKPRGLKRYRRTR